VWNRQIDRNRFLSASNQTLGIENLLCKLYL
jgi:hypothetical protein